MEENDSDQIPVVSAKSEGSKNHARVVGLITLGNILAKVSHGRATMTDPVSKVMFKFDKTRSFTPITKETHLKELTKFFDNNSAAVITNKDGGVESIVTKIDLVKFLAKQALQKPAKKAKK